MYSDLPLNYWDTVVTYHKPPYYWCGPHMITIPAFRAGNRPNDVPVLSFVIPYDYYFKVV